MKSKGRTERRIVALGNLRTAKFFPKTLKNGTERTEDAWNKRVKQEIATLEKLVR